MSINDNVISLKDKMSDNAINRDATATKSIMLTLKYTAKEDIDKKNDFRRLTLRWPCPSVNKV